MARGTAVIFNGMMAEKNGFANLGGLIQANNYLTPLTPANPFNSLLNQINSASVVAVWLLFLYIVADAMNTLEVMWDNMMVQLNQAAASAVVCNLPWYESIMQQWQHGYSLAWNPNTRRAYYVDTVSQAAVASQLLNPINGGRVSMNEVTNINFDGVVAKVAKSDGNGGLMQLDTTPGGEADNAAYYLKRQKPAGVQTSLITLPADKLKLDMVVPYDGQLDLPTFQAAFIAAVNSFLSVQQAIGTPGIIFDGLFVTDTFIDYCENIPGVIVEPGVGINSIQALPAGGSYVPVIGSYNPASGYFILDPTSNIQYVAS
jgi:hypothetical protein